MTPIRFAMILRPPVGALYPQFPAWYSARCAGMRSHFVAAIFALSILASACSSRKDIVGSGCETCHRPPDSDQGLEEQHALFALRCVDCHGGDPAARSVADAHVPNNAPGGNVRS